MLKLLFISLKNNSNPKSYDEDVSGLIKLFAVVAPQQKYVDWKIVGTLKPSPQLDLIINWSDGLNVPVIFLVVFEPNPS